MAVFVLKKYSDLPEEPTVDIEEGKTQEEQVQEKNEEIKKEKVEERLQIEATGSIAEIVAKALYRILGDNKEVVIEEDPDLVDPTAPIQAKVITTEDINANPLTSLRSIQEGQSVCVVAESFSTEQEEWFLTNLENKTNKIHYSVESFLTKIVGDFLR